MEQKLLADLASSEGNILENKTLLISLNELKSKSTTVKEKLEEASVLQESLGPNPDPNPDPNPNPDPDPNPNPNPDPDPDPNSNPSPSPSPSPNSGLQESLDEQREMYRGIAKVGSRLFFTLLDLRRINPMYRYSLPMFLALFKKALAPQPLPYPDPDPDP